MKTEIKDIDAYIAGAELNHRSILEEMRTIIKKAAPKAEEVISYGMPAFKQYSVLVYFAAAKKHLGFYPTGGPTTVFAKELKGYVTTKGAIQFPWDKKLPAALITKIVKYRIKEDAEKALEKSSKKPVVKKSTVTTKASAPKTKKAANKTSTKK